MKLHISYTFKENQPINGLNWDRRQYSKVSKLANPHLIFLM